MICGFLWYHWARRQDVGRVAHDGFAGALRRAREGVGVRGEAGEVRGDGRDGGCE